LRNPVETSAESAYRTKSEINGNDFANRVARNTDLQRTVNHNFQTTRTKFPNQIMGLPRMCFFSICGVFYLNLIIHLSQIERRSREALETLMRSSSPNIANIRTFNILSYGKGKSSIFESIRAAEQFLGTSTDLHIYTSIVGCHDESSNIEFPCTR